MKLALTDSGREFMYKAFKAASGLGEGTTENDEKMEDASNILSIFEVHGPVIDSDKIFELAYSDTYKRPYPYDWSKTPVEKSLVHRLVKQLFEARYLEEVQEYDEDNILMTLNPAAIPLEEAMGMHQKAKWERMKREYRMDNYGEY